MRGLNKHTVIDPAITVPIPFPKNSKKDKVSLVRYFLQLPESRPLSCLDFRTTNSAARSLPITAKLSCLNLVLEWLFFPICLLPLGSQTPCQRNPPSSSRYVDCPARLLTFIKLAFVFAPRRRSTLDSEVFARPLFLSLMIGPGFPP